MDSPRYTITVTNLTQGWAYETTHQEWDGATLADLPDVVLTDSLVYEWAFTGDLIPGQLEPTQAQVSLRAIDVDHIPTTQVGDLVTLDVRFPDSTGPGPSVQGTRIIAPPPMRVSVITASVTPGQGAAVTLTLVDLSADWRATALGEKPAGTWVGSLEDLQESDWRHALGEVSRRLGLTIGRPSSWDGDDFLPVDQYLGYRGEWPDAGEAVERLLNSHQPNGQTHAYTTIYQDSHPTGWEDVESGTSGWGTVDVPDSTVRIEIVEASRRTPGSIGLPFVFEVVDGVLTVTPQVSSTDLTQIGLHADWVDAPATLRRSRDHAVNTVNLTGIARDYGEDGTSAQWTEFTEAYTDADDVAARGTVARDVETDIYLGTIGNYDDPVPPDAPDAAAARFMSDESARQAGWAFDAFQLVSHRMPQDVAEALLPYIAPRLPGETDGDDRIVRHVTIIGLDESVRLNGEPVAGFVVGGSLTVTGGDLVWSLRMVPGLPVWTDTAPDPVTVAELETVATGLTYADIDPDIRWADLAYVDA